MTQFSHLNAAGEANMVDVSDKPNTKRIAVAQSELVLSSSLMDKIRAKEIAKGDLLAVARVAGIQAAKHCADLIPLCHPLPLSKVEIDINEIDTGLLVKATCITTAQTGVEMEALTAASVTALTIYDMCKAVDKGIVIENTKLLSKSGGKSGDWQRDD